MKNNNLLLFLVFFLLIIVSLKSIISLDQSININYNSTNEDYYEKLIEFSSVLIKLNTAEDSICKYSTSPGLSYSDMTNNFDLSAGKLHEKTFSDLGDGIYKYYIKCKSDSAVEGSQLRLVLRVNSLVSASILLSKEDPLGFGKVDLTLTTSKIVSSSPDLKYSFDGISYNQVPLFGSETKWKGYLVIPKNTGEASLSFKFSSNDLQGRQGTQITSGSVFFVDTVKPSPIYEIKAVGYDGEIRLSWVYDEEYESFKIYRSTTSNPQYIDFYKSVEETSFRDLFVDKGKTYYYRVSGLDSAGNEGDLSKEIFATALLSNDSIDNGLALELVGYVDSFISEVEDFNKEITTIQDSFSNLGEKENYLYEKLGFKKDIQGAIIEINSLKSEVTRYKLQNLNENDLNKKIDSARLKFEIIRKKIPESFSISDEITKKEEITQQLLEETLLKLKPDITSSDKKKTIEQSLDLIKSSNLEIQDQLYNINVVYLDGSTKEFSIVDKRINAQLEKSEFTNFIETISINLEDEVNEIEFVNSDIEILQNGLISFQTDSKYLTYIFNTKKSLSTLADSNLVLLSFYQATNQSKLTGYSILEIDYKSYIGLIIGFFVLIFIAGYLLYLKRNPKSDYEIDILNTMETGRKNLNKNNFQEALNDYNGIINNYSKLGKKTKEKLYKRIIKYHNELLIQKIKRSLEQFESTRDKVILNSIEKDYSLLSSDSQKKIRPILDKIKEEAKK